MTCVIRHNFLTLYRSKETRPGVRRGPLRNTSLWGGFGALRAGPQMAVEKDPKVCQAPGWRPNARKCG
jgi:hypothetical protein